MTANCNTNHQIMKINTEVSRLKIGKNRADTELSKNSWKLKELKAQPQV